MRRMSDSRDPDAGKVVFLSEAAELLNQIEQSLFELEGSLDDDTLLNRFFSAFDTFKDPGIVLGVNSVSQFSREIIAIFDQIHCNSRRSRRHMVDLCRAVIDIIRIISKQASAQNRLAEKEAKRIITALRLISAKLTTTLSEQEDRQPGQSRKQSKEIHSGKELEKRVEQHILELQESHIRYLHAEKLSVIGKLSASIAHEFNNPLQGVITILKGLKRRAILEDEDMELLDLAIEENERMKNLVRSLQDFNQPARGRKSKMDVHVTMDSLLLLYKSDFENKGISTIVNYAEKLPRILAIPDQIKQVFLNLLNNAMDACTEADRVITISTRQEGQRIVIAIKDSGIGIIPENLDLIYHPFFTTKSEVKGTGLGLSICHGIIRNHQGEIHVESQPGKGSTFTVLLPVHRE